MKEVTGLAVEAISICLQKSQFLNSVRDIYIGSWRYLLSLVFKFQVSFKNIRCGRNVIDTVFANLQPTHKLHSYHSQENVSRLPRLLTKDVLSRLGATRSVTCLFITWIHIAFFATMMRFLSAKPEKQVAFLHANQSWNKPTDWRRPRFNSCAT